MRRKDGFSLVELLIVLAVMAALIATITPVALNAIRKAKATQVAQNLKTLASAFENKVYVDGSAPSTLDSLARDINTSNYGLAYTESNGTYTVVVFTNEDVTLSQVQNVLADASGSGSTSGYSFLSDGLTSTTGGTVFYTFSFTAY
ncbi:type II secretion system protein [Kosmotoga pacifica]|uniref:N-terminal cleavage protein n=1 Tax=Kosmotoga pacifica TaxID=1330330 RepID=A0A0G2ZAC7_9BACT|nr:type II secretion system protein [Kosmotoga pacifica]AKI96529.1 N-terminal cleavage protein [Kosmotoga pacifica]